LPGGAGPIPRRGRPAASATGEPEE
jgi:hypothetical protein